MSSRSFARELLYFALCAAATIPLFAVEWPPIQDLPQHLAAVRVLTDYGDPSLRFAEYFTIDLFRTQYLAYYLAARLLAPLVGVLLANKLLIGASLLATPYAMRWLLRALGRDDRPSLFVLPLLWNAHLLLGFLNFIAALPLCLVGLALAVELRRDFRTRQAIALSIVAVIAFYTHVVPFGFLFIGAFAVALGGNLGDSLRRAAPLAPSAVAALVWSAMSPAGRATTTAARLRSEGDAPAPEFVAIAQNLAQAPSWVMDVLRGPADDGVLVAWVILALACFVLAPLEPKTDATEEAKSARTRIALLAPLSLALYFALPASYDWIWPINARFALLTPLFVVVALPSPGRTAGALIFSGAATLGLFMSLEVTRAFQRFDREEVADFDAAIEEIPEGSRVAGLIFDPSSEHVRFSPFLHSAAMVQAKRGGAVMFTFMDFPQSPIRFREENRPPKVQPRWEWTPQRVDPRTDLEWYDYVVVRGGPGAIARMPERWSSIYEGERWRVYRRATISAHRSESAALLSPPGENATSASN